MVLTLGCTGRGRTRVLAFVAILILGVRGNADQSTVPDHDRTTLVKQTIRDAFDRNIQNSTRTIAPGVRAYTPAPLNDSEVSRITSFGDVAVPVLAAYLEAASPAYRVLALRCLGAIGGTQVIRILERTTLSATQSQIVRKVALEWVASYSGAEADQSLRRMAATVTDPSIRRRAAELLSNR